MAKTGAEMREIPYVVEHIQRAADMVAEQTRRRTEFILGSDLEKGHKGGGPQTFDSPLEASFWLWWYAFNELERQDDFLALEMRREVSIRGQRFKPDFVLTPRADPVGDIPPEFTAYFVAHWQPTAVEMDGHAFHETTLDQVTYRNQRDRALQDAGWKVFHFSFSEFSNDPNRCVWEVLASAYKQNSEILNEWIATRRAK